jgi:Mn-dependent DtxR family transcriptional regulator
MIVDNKQVLNELIIVKRYLRGYNNMSVDQFILLLSVYELKRIDVKELSMLLEVSEQTLLILKKKLIKAGYIVDHYTLALSDKGIELCKEFRRFVLLSSCI